MSDTTYIGRSMKSFHSAPQFDGFSRVVITVSDEIEYSAGTETGRTLRLDCPWGTAQMARNILNDIRGFQYQPYSADGAILDPAAELGDGITANNVYSGIYTSKIKFGPLLTATVSAPEDEEINHEYPYKSKPDRKITRETGLLRASLTVQADRISAEIVNRQTAERELQAALTVQANRITAEVSARETAIDSVRSTLTVQSDQIEAKVSKTGGGASTFGWVLDDESWTINANGKTVLKATKSGLEIQGKITATSGKIGGFDIKSNRISYNDHTWKGTNTEGIYIGTNGIKLGKNFKVDREGNLTAASGTFTGSVNAGSIRYGKDEDTEEDYGRLSGSGIKSNSIKGGSSGQIAGSSLGTFNLTGGVNSSLGYADYAYGVFNDWNSAPVVRCDSLRVGGDYFNPITIYYTTATGTTNYVTLLGHR